MHIQRLDMTHSTACRALRLRARQDRPDAIRVQGVRLAKRHRAFQLPTPTESPHDV